MTKQINEAGDGDDTLFEESEVSDERCLQELADLRASIRKDEKFDEEMTERAWAAGFFDGEGHAGTNIPTISSSGSLEMNVKQTTGNYGFELLDRFRKVVGVGEIDGPWRSKNPDHQPQYRWRTTREADVAAVMHALAPFLGLAKYKQLRRAIHLEALRYIRSEETGRRKTTREGLSSIELPTDNGTEAGDK